jgi:hypothetical protein
VIETSQWEGVIIFNGKVLYAQYELTAFKKHAKLMMDTEHLLIKFN